MKYEYLFDALLPFNAEACYVQDNEKGRMSQQVRPEKRVAIREHSEVQIGTSAGFFRENAACVWLVEPDNPIGVVKNLNMKV